MIGKDEMYVTSLHKPSWVCVIGNLAYGVGEVDFRIHLAPIGRWGCRYLT